MNMLLIGKEQVERQGLILVFQLIHKGVEVIKGQNGHDGTKDLLAHHRIPFGHIVHDGGSDLASVGLGFATDHHLALVDQTTQAGEVLVVDDLAVILVFQGLITVLFANLRNNLGNERILDAFLRQIHSGVACKGGRGFGAAEEKP